MKDARSTLRGVKSAVFSLAVGTVMAVCLLEGLIRLWIPPAATVRGGDIVLPVHRRIEWSNPTPDSKLDRTITLQYNELGFRGPPAPVNFDDHLTFVTVGGSTTACTLLSDGKTWPDRLAERLKRTFDGVWVNNAGFDGHTTFGHTKLMQHAVGPLRPDYVLFLVGINDIGREKPRFTDLHLDPAGGGQLDLWLKQLLRRSAVVWTLETLIRSRWANRSGLSHQEVDFVRGEHVQETPLVWTQEIQKHVDKHLPAYRDRLRTLIRMTREFGSEPILITQTFLGGQATDPSTGALLAYGQTKPGISTGLAAELVERYNATTKELGAEEGVFVIDLANEFPKDSRYYYDWMHYTNEGADLVAERIVSALIPFVRERLVVLPK